MIVKNSAAVTLFQLSLAFIFLLKLYKSIFVLSMSRDIVYEEDRKPA